MLTYIWHLGNPDIMDLCATSSSSRLGLGLLKGVVEQRGKAERSRHYHYTDVPLR